MNEDLGAVVLLAIYATVWLLAILLFVMPAFIAFRRDHPNRWLILMVNIFLGGTGIGWGVALVWALRIIHLPDEGASYRGGESGLNLFANDVSRVRIEPSMFRTSSANGAAPSSSNDALQQIERLGQLYAEGHINQAEFTNLKAAIICRL